ncbi:MAG: hypothetical protein ACLFUJ_10700, partial [Phycisphaerae bacterium]
MAETNNNPNEGGTLRDQAEAKNAAFLQQLLSSPEAEGAEVLSGPDVDVPAPQPPAPAEAPAAQPAEKMAQDDIDAMIAA